MNRFRMSAAAIALLAAVGCSNDPNVVKKKYVDNGNRYYDRGKYKEASILYRKALQKDPRYGEAYYRLGLTELKLNQWNDAAGALSRAVDTDKTNVDARVKLADLYLAGFLQSPKRKDLIDDVRNLAQDLLKRNPKSFDGLRLMGYVALTQRDLKGSIAKFEEANQAKPYQPELILALTQALFADNQNDLAIKTGRDLINRNKQYGPIYDILAGYYLRNNQPDQAEQLYKERIANAPANGQYLIELANFYRGTKRPADMQATLARLTNDQKTFTNAFFLVGDFDFSTGDFDGAMQNYRTGIEKDSKNKVTYQKRMAEMLAMHNQPDQAEKIVTELLKSNPTDPEAIAMRASLSLRSGGPDKIKAAIADLQPLVAKYPESSVLHYNLGRAYMVKGDTEQARLQMQDAVRLSPNYFPAKMALGELELGKGENPKAIQNAEEILAQHPDSVSARLMRTLGMMNMGEMDKSRQELNLILAKYPKLPDARYQLALIDYNQKKYKDAETSFQILRDANDPRGLVGMVECKLAEGQHDQAIQMLETELGKNPDRSDYRLALANIQVRGKKYDEALGNFQKLIDKSPNNGPLYLRMAETKRQKGDLAGGLEGFKKARELMPNDPTPVLQMALLQDAQGRREDAKASYEQVLKTQPDNPIALNNIAYMKADEGTDLDQALTLAERARRKLPDNDDVVDTLCLIYLRKNLVDDAIRYSRNIVNKHPENPGYHLHLAMALYQKGDKPSAKKELELASRNHPTDKDLGKIKELMQKIG